MVGVETGFATIRIGAVAGCPACDAGNGCGAGVFGRLLRRRPLLLRLTNGLDVQPGQLVTVGIPEHVFLQLVLKLYLVPLLAGLAGAAIGHHLAGRGFAHPAILDTAALIGAVSLGGLALWLARFAANEPNEDRKVTLLRVDPVTFVPAGCSPPGTSYG